MTRRPFSLKLEVTLAGAQPRSMNTAKNEAASPADVEQVPASASALFGDALPRAVRFAQMLTERSDELGLLGPRELPKLWSRHILNSAIIGELLRPGDRVADVGSGAGFPGIPMAILRPDVQFDLIEPMERRAAWLQSVIDELELGNVRVIRKRAEDVGDAGYDVATARAVAATDKLLKLLTPLVRAGKDGRVIAIKGQKVQQEIADAAKVIQRLKLAEVSTTVLGESRIPESVTLLLARVNHRE